MNASTILIVDDEISNRLLLCEMLEDYICFTADGGEAMWRVLAQQSIDLILLDVMMPNEDGFSLGKKLKAHKTFAKIPIVYVTAKVTGKDIDEGFRSGAFDYIKKPYNIKELENRVKKALSETEQTQTLKAQSVTADLVFDTILDGLIITDDEFKITKANPAATNTLRCSKGSLESLSLSDMLCDKDGNLLSITELIHKTTNVWFLNAEQELVPIRLTLAAITDELGNEIAWAGTFQDITAQIEIEQSLIKAKEEAENASKIKSSFIASISHELRTPLNSILGFSDLLHEDDIPEDYRKRYAEAIKSSGKKLQSFIENLLDISVIESGQLTIEKKSCNISQLCEGLYREFIIIKDTFPNSNVELVKSTNIPENFQYKTELNRLRQILFNLLENACKFTQSGQIVFSYNINEQENVLEFSVQDSGVGIAEDKLEGIFTSFKKVDESHHITGAGLGLSITKNLVQILGGTISVESKIDEGSTFSVKFPL